MSEIGEREAVSSCMSATIMKMNTCMHGYIDAELKTDLLLDFNLITTAGVKSQIAKRACWDELKNHG